MPDVRNSQNPRAETEGLSYNIHEENVGEILFCRFWVRTKGVMQHYAS